VRARAIVDAVTHWQDAAKLAAVSEGLGAPLTVIVAGALAEAERLAARGR
jgi:pyridoxal 5'-phosphate synthase pdxS subunit